MKEIWKDIKNFNGDYQISNYGRVKSKLHSQDKILKTKLNNNYEYINIRNNTLKIHRLVAQAFIPNPNNYPEINHKDDIRNNNNVNNLEWCTRKYNCNYGNFKLTKNKNLCIKVNQYDLKGNFINQYSSLTEAEKETKVDHSSIAKCCRNKVKRAGKYVWKYVDAKVSLKDI